MVLAGSADAPAERLQRNRSAAQVGPDSVGASEGFLGWVAYLGAANAGIPLSIIVKTYGWEVRPPVARQTPV